uniref:Elongation factor EFG domain-containing protein n=1 Tax=Hemiselmis andersenii TaxID=464988 RepID=A0A7S1DM63_HEMAN
MQSRKEVEGALITGFQLSTLSGPLCEEPMEGVAFVVDDVRFTGPPDEVHGVSDSYGPWSGQVISAVKEGCRAAFLAGERRLVEAVFDCQVTTQVDSLGKAYSVLSKRRARVVDEQMRDGTDTFVVSSILPVAESFGLADDLRKQTSGAATCHLTMAGWELMDSDPFWVPLSEEELEDTDQSDIDTARGAARKCMDLVRKRKGLSVQEKLVSAAEKQRTRSRRK